LETVREFLGQPMVAPIYILIVLAVLNFVLKVFASLKPGWPGTFDWAILPQMLDTLVLRKVVPLLLLGIASYITPSVQIAGVDLNVQLVLQSTYVLGCGIAIAAEIATIRTAFPSANGAPAPDGG
jgi:hypothetical protein